MRELNKTYGPIDWNDPNGRLPLDWRHPHVHAISWATKGLRVADKKPDQHIGEHGEHGKHDYSTDEVNADRMIYHSLQDLFRSGTIHIWDSPATNPSSGAPQERKKDIFLRPDLRMFEPYNQITMKIIKKYTNPSDKEESSHQIGHRNMLQNALLSFFQAGHQQQAQRIYDQLRKLYPRKEFNVPLAQFARTYFQEELKTLDILNAREMILLTLREG
jgi:hypothetical protein